MVRNALSEISRQSIIDRRLEAGLFVIRCNLAAFAHGWDREAGSPASLIVFEFSFNSTEGAARFTHASISVKFSYNDPDLGLCDPEVVAVAPSGLWTLDHTTATKISKAATSGSVGIIAPISASAVGGIGGIGLERGRVTETKLFATVSGRTSLREREFGADNTAEWDLTENKQSKMGIASRLRAAVLLKRIDRTSKFVAHCTFDDIQTAGGSWARKILRPPRIIDDPVYFDPSQTTTRHPEKIRGLDLENLGAIDIRELADATHAVPWAASGRGDQEKGHWKYAGVRLDPISVKISADASVGPIPAGPGLGPSKILHVKKESGLFEIGYGSNLNEKLFNISLGTPEETWFKFKRFDNLGLLNLCHYQHKLVQLESEIHECQGNISPDKVNELATTLGEYCKDTNKIPENAEQRSNLLTYADAAIKMFKEISQMQRPKPGTTRTIAEWFAKVIGEEHGRDYLNMGDSMHMIDLSPEALNVTSDPIRVLLQRRFGSDDGEDDSKQALLGSGRGVIGSVLHAPGKPTPSGSRISPWIDEAARYLVSFGGGLLLLAPIYALSFVHTQSYQLITVTIFVIGFAVLVAAIIPGSNDKLLAATAAYAAVLVVFLSRS